jgi:hypothetical protein
MSKKSLTAFVCTGKDCRKSWHRFITGSPTKWLKKHVEEAGLPVKLHLVQTECMDQCENAAALCIVNGGCSAWATQVRSAHDADRVLGLMRSLID